MTTRWARSIHDTVPSTNCAVTPRRSAIHRWAVQVFFHSDPTRNTIDPVIVPLAMQPIEAIRVPDRHRDIATSFLFSLIFVKPRETQFTALVSGPLRQITCTSHVHAPFLLLLYGSGECIGYAAQTHLIHAVSASARKQENEHPALVLFGRRAECSVTHPLQTPCPARARPRLRAIHRAHIRTVEPIGARSPPSSSSPPSHALRFVPTADTCPTAQLTVLRGPFTPLDAFYTHIVVPACASSPGRYLLPRARCKSPSADLRWAWSASRSSVYARDTRRDALHSRHGLSAWRCACVHPPHPLLSY